MANSPCIILDQRCNQVQRERERFMWVKGHFMTNICVNFNCKFFTNKTCRKKKNVGDGGAITAPNQVPYNKCHFFHPQNE